MFQQRAWYKPAVAGGLAGVANGLFGGGGGLILVPLLIGWCKLDTRKAFATSVSIILPLCLLSSAIYLLRGDLSLQAALPYVLGGGLGGLLAGHIFVKLNTQVLRKIFALLLLYGGIKSLFF